MKPIRVAVFNAAPHAQRLSDRCAALPVELRHVEFRIPWEEVAGRRAGRIPAPVPVAPELRAELAGAEVALAFAPPIDIRQLAPHLRWVETPATGVDQLNGTGLLGGEVAVTTIGGLFAPAVAEHVFALLFALWRRTREFAALQERREWKVLEVRELQDATMGIVGLGNIGQAVARAARAFGMRVLGTRRRAEQVPEGVERVFPRQQLGEMLAESDVVVVAVTGSAETANLIGAAELARMKRDAVLINVARGIVVDQDALVEALAQGRIGGAGLDVFVEEPLPRDSALWTLPNAVLTPHIAPNTPSKLRRCIDHFARNLAHYCAAEPLEDRVAGC